MLCGLVNICRRFEKDREVTHISGSFSPRTDLIPLDPEKEGITILQNFSSYLPIYTAQKYIILNFSYTKVGVSEV